MDEPHHTFQFMSHQHGTWAHRGGLILAELAAHDPDIAGLQEVSHVEDLGHAFSATHCVLSARKLDSVAAPGDGCVLLLRKARFSVVAVHCLYYHSTAPQPAPLSNQNAIIATLHDSLAGRWLVVAVTHLKSAQSPQNEATRLCQVEQLVAAVRAARLKAEEHSSGQPVPTLIVGDFNTFPGQRPYAALLTLAPDMASAYNSLTRTAQDTSTQALAAYAQGEPAFTTYKFRAERGGEKKVTEDYIFYSPGKGLARQALLRLPSVAELGEGRGIPSAKYPSDHLLLGCRLEWEAGEGEAAAAAGQ